jgi:hypothetical protein
MTWKAASDHERPSGIAGSSSAQVQEATVPFPRHRKQPDAPAEKQQGVNQTTSVRRATDSTL